MHIHELNDALRVNLSGGQVMMTQGFTSLPSITQRKAFSAMRSSNDFTEDNDPYGEHDFGSIKIDGETIFWKVSYYDKSLENGSEDPSNPEVTERVLTIMLASEY